jgi:hypothetical protein
MMDSESLRNIKFTTDMADHLLKTSPHLVTEAA